MGSLRDKVSSTSLLATTTLVSSGLTRKRGEASTTGRVRRATSMRVSSRAENAMGAVLSGGVMAAGMRVSSGMVSRVVGECCIEKVAIESIRATGTTACSTEKAHSISRTGSVTKAPSRRTSSTGTASSTRMTPSFTESGRITSYQWSIW
jgi:hypothetical protein